jgi:hypothetical protein
MAFGLMVVQNAMAFGTIDVAFGTMSNISVAFGTI